MTTHTPGPWNYEPEDNLIFSADGVRIIDVSLIPRSIHVGMDERKANGQLAAAAPELLEALEDLKSELVLSDVDPDYIESHFRPSLNKAAAAIAKSMGDRLGQLAAESSIAKATGA